MIWFDAKDWQGMTHGFRASIPCLSFFVALLAFAGCAKDDKVKLYPVKGKVIVDGKPVEGALLTMYAKSSEPKLQQAVTATTKSDGSYAVGTYEPEDGAPAGEYTVTIFHFPPDAQAIMMRTGVVPNLLPAQYSDPMKSSLTIEVKEQANEIAPFKLKGKGP